MRDYEVTLVVQPQLEEEERNELVERVGELLVPGEKEGNLTVHHWGQRQLAYEIKKFYDGYYVHYEAKIDPTRISEIERSMGFMDDILRTLVVRKEE